MIHLVIKGDHTEAFEAARDRGISVVGVTPLENSLSCLAVAYNEHELAIVKWFCETDARSCRPGFGYPPGTLLHYTFRN